VHMPVTTPGNYLQTIITLLKIVTLYESLIEIALVLDIRLSWGCVILMTFSCVYDGGLGEQKS